ncbi:MAG TPA: hypothetical protein VIY52_36315 [Streptosporangiaceae bacterium]
MSFDRAADAAYMGTPDTGRGTSAVCGESCLLDRIYAAGTTASDRPEAVRRPATRTRIRTTVEPAEERTERDPRYTWLPP